MDKKDDNKDKNNKENSKTNKKAKAYETRRSKAEAAANDDTIISGQPEEQPLDIVDSKKNKRSYKANKQGDNKTTVTTKKLCIKEVDKENDPTMFVVVKTAKGNQVFCGMEFASEYIKAYPGCQVSIHMDMQSASEDLAVNMAATITPEKTNNDDKKAQANNNENNITPFAYSFDKDNNEIMQESPECININKLEQKQRAHDKEANVIQPFQPPEEQRKEIEREIQQNMAITRTKIQFMYFLVNHYIIVAIQFLNASGKPYWCWKTEAVAMAMAKNLIKLPTHPAMSVLAEFSLRKERNGANEPKTVFNKTRNSNFEVRALSTNFCNNNWNQPIQEQVKSFALTFESYIKSEKFPSYYLWALPNARGGKIVTKIQDQKHKFWKDIRGAAVEVINGHHLDTLFMDQQIMNFANCLIPPESNPRDWSYKLRRQLYRSGEIPASFFS